jgi:dUTP pyrophosphatase
MKVKLSENAIMPTRAHPWDAGLDLYARNNRTIDGYGRATFDTGVHIEIPEGCVGLIKSKSGLMVNHNLTADGTIDAHYTGSIRVKLFNHWAIPYEVKAGDKIAQLVIVPCLLPDLELVDELEETDRGACGFGSTGK